MATEVYVGRLYYVVFETIDLKSKIVYDKENLAHHEMGLVHLSVSGKARIITEHGVGTSALLGICVPLGLNTGQQAASLPSVFPAYEGLRWIFSN